MEAARLITIPFRHYCKKARWALDATGVPYREERHAPLVHMRATRAVGGKTVPVLVHGERVFCDSGDIVRHDLAATTTGRHVLRVYREHRTRAEPCQT